MFTKNSDYVKFSISNLRDYAKQKHMVITYYAEKNKFTIWIYKKKSFGRKELLNTIEGKFNTYFSDPDGFNTKWDEAHEFIRTFNS